MAEFNRDYFNVESGAQDRSRKGRFFHLDEVTGFEAAAGLVLKPIWGENLMLSFVYMEPHSVAPEHSHPEEQMGLVIDGEYEFDINGEKRLCRRGDVYWIPPNVPHSARTYEKGCFALDVFNPPRQAFKALQEAAEKRRREGGGA
ncbi:MAG: cupin domain-containing protein [Firmicutes bacterium]|nr:cupin domain-containing protein [Bacillota bacterium]